jgi:hypothetical protein
MAMDDEEELRGGGSGSGSGGRKRDRAFGTDSHALRGRDSAPKRREQENRPEYEVPRGGYYFLVRGSRLHGRVTII